MRGLPANTRRSRFGPSCDLPTPLPGVLSNNRAGRSWGLFVCLRACTKRPYASDYRSEARAAPATDHSSGAAINAFRRSERARTMAAYATMDKAPVCTAELIMLAHARLPPNQRPPCGDMHLVWLLIGKELGDQLAKRRGVRLEGLGDIILTVDGIRLVKGGICGARGPHIPSTWQP